MALELATLTPPTLTAALALTLRPEQERFVAPVADSVCEALATPTAWPRVVLDDGAVAGFVMANWDAEAEIPAFRAGLWRLNVAGAQQGRGVGAFAVRAVADEARSRGLARITVLWVPGEGGPEGFYLKQGFVPTGEVLFGETIGALDL